MRKNIIPDEPNDESVNHPSNINRVEWSYDNEEMLAEWCDIAQCYKWLYGQTHSYYSNLHAWFTIPCIIFSTITGTASFALTSLPYFFQIYAPMIIGSINIFIGIISTIQQYLKVSELKESHRISSVTWDKFSRNISIELAKAPYERISAGPFLKYSRQEFDRLMENNQIIPSHILHRFNYIFKGKTLEEKHKFDLITKPDICDSITSIHSKRHLWFITREDGSLNKNRSSSRQSNNEKIIEQNNEKILEKKNNYMMDNFKEKTSSYTDRLPRPMNKIQLENTLSSFSIPIIKKKTLSETDIDKIPPPIPFKKKHNDNNSIIKNRSISFTENNVNFLPTIPPIENNIQFSSNITENFSTSSSSIISDSPIDDIEDDTNNIPPHI